MALPYKPPIPADAFAAAVPAACILLHFVRLGAIELCAGEPFPNTLSEPFDGLPDPFCAKPPVPFEPSKVDPSGNGPFPNALSELFDGLPDPFCAKPPVPFEPSKVDPSCIGLATLVPVSTAAACVTVTVY